MQRVVKCVQARWQCEYMRGRKVKGTLAAARANFVRQSFDALVFDLTSALLQKIDTDWASQTRCKTNPMHRRIIGPKSISMSLC